MNAEIYRFKVGTFECIAVSDGTFAYPDHSLFINARKERLEQVLREHNIQTGEISSRDDGVPYCVGKLRDSIWRRPAHLRPAFKVEGVSTRAGNAFLCLS
jgi:hypothetical protein